MRDGKIAAVGTRAKTEALPEAASAERLDLGGRVVLPGFVDSHTHLIHAASRAEEYELKIAGASYEEIARKGGGILNSVKKLRAATSEALKQRARRALKQFASYGTTTIEAKSGYGLDVASELKILRLHKELAAEQPLDIVSTFLGAHVVPAEYRGTPLGVQEVHCAAHGEADSRSGARATGRILRRFLRPRGVHEGAIKAESWKQVFGTG